MELAESGRVDDRYRHLGRASFRAAGVKICLRVFQLSSIVSRIKFQQQRSRLDEVGIFDQGIDVRDGSTDARANQVQMPFNLSVIGGFVVLRMQPPHGTAGEGGYKDRKKNPARNSSNRRCFFRVPMLTAGVIRGIALWSHSRSYWFIHINEFRFDGSCHGHLPPRSSWSFVSAPPMARENEIIATL